MSMTRKQFIGSLLGGAALLACGGDDGGKLDGSTMRNCAANGTNATISNNHGHAITVTSTDVGTAQEKTYDIRGTSDHTHSVTITAGNFATLQSNANGSIQATSTSVNGHTHTITVTCA